MGLKQWLIVIVCAFYVLSPIDLLPEAVLGPLGLPDDLIAIFMAWRNVKQAWSDVPQIPSQGSN